MTDKQEAMWTALVNCNDMCIGENAEWAMVVEPHMGTVYFHRASNDGSLGYAYATPFWEGLDGVELEITNAGGQLVHSEVLPLYVSGDAAADRKTYLATMEAALKKHGHLLMLDPEACPGCGCMPGDGKTPGCTDPDGCCYNN
jgi:hypothetical protein